MTTRTQHWKFWARPRVRQDAATAVTTRAAGAREASRAARDARLKALLSGAELALLLNERYDAERETWTVDVLRKDALYDWREQRYVYDAAVDVFYFWGEQRLTDEAVRRLNPHALPRLIDRSRPSLAHQPSQPAPATAPAAQPAPVPAAGPMPGLRPAGVPA